MKSRPIKKLIAYGFFPFIVIFLVASPLLGFNIVEAQSNGCNDFTNFHLGQCIGTGFAYLLEGLNTLFGFLLFLTGKLLDFAIEFSINPVGDLYRSDTVSTAWNLLRDIINMSFIFI